MAIWRLAESCLSSRLRVRSIIRLCVTAREEGMKEEWERKGVGNDNRKLLLSKCYRKPLKNRPDLPTLEYIVA